MPTAAPTTTHCPLCGQSNGCAVAAGLPAQQCWCMRESVSREALARLPAEARGRACICPLCAREEPAAPQAPAPILPRP